MRTFKILVVCLLFCQIASFGCTLPHQLRSYTEYQFHDLKVDNDAILVLLEKKRYKPELSPSHAMMGKIPSKTDYRFISYAILFFEKNYVGKNTSDRLLLNNKINIINSKNISQYLRNKIIDRDRILSWKDIINDKPYPSVISFKNNIYTKHITTQEEEIYAFSSFNIKKYYYFLNDKIFFYDIDKDETVELTSKKHKESFAKTFTNTKYVSNNGKLFFDYNGGDINTNLVKYIISDKINNSIVGTFSSSYLNIQDFYDKEEESRILAYDPFIGLEIFDINGNSLYALHENSLSFIQRAVMHNDKVYAAGLVSKDEALGKAQYIEILVWDYKNGSTTRKNYPCDSPELEM